MSVFDYAIAAPFLFAGPFICIAVIFAITGIVYVEALK